MAPYHPRPLVRENAFYAPRPGPSPYQQPQPLQREPAYYSLPIDSPPRFPHFQTIGRGALKREPAMYNVVPPEQQRSRIPAPIYAEAGAPRPQIYRAAGVAAVYKRVRWGSCTDRSGSGRRHHVKNVKSTYPEDVTHRPTRQPRQLLKPGKRLHKDGSHPSLIPTFGSSKKVVLKGHYKWESSG
ncbi:hypothetical protein BDZ89DRAFT_1071131 [Hymenopellis radicata]|nr:hypothetical protein BDZ89DRAFT_1071131 [Hymenopellis radicata]